MELVQLTDPGEGDTDGDGVDDDQELSSPLLTGGLTRSPSVPGQIVEFRYANMTVLDSCYLIGGEASLEGWSVSTNGGSRTCATADSAATPTGTCGSVRATSSPASSGTPRTGSRSSTNILEEGEAFTLGIGVNAVADYGNFTNRYGYPVIGGSDSITLRGEKPEQGSNTCQIAISWTWRVLQ